MDIRFKKGIPGLEGLKNFKILDLEDNEQFKILQSMEEENVSFVVANPFEIYKEYVIDLNDEIIKELEIKNSEDVLVLSIITLGETLEKSTLNLKAPLIMNIKNNLGRQLILQSEKYETKHPLMRSEKYVSNY